MDYDQASVVITGASRGIGRHIALGFASETDRPLLLLARSEEGLKTTREMCLKAGAGRVHVISCDLADSAVVGRLTCPDDFPSPGIVINNAGSYLYRTLEETGTADFAEQLQANLFTAVNVTNRFLESLKKLDRGLIINICSVGSLEGLAESGAYAASKHALLGYTRSLRKELMSSNISVTAVNLGQTRSTSWEESDIDPRRLIDPADIASLLVALSGLSPQTVAEEIILKPQHGRVPPM